jgi:cell division protein FtsZ
MLVEVGERGHSPAELKVIGLGGGGNNAVNRMLESDIRGVEFLVANTDIQALNVTKCEVRIQIGSSVTGGLGSGGDPQLGRKAAEEDRETIRGHLEGADMVFITAGMGGGTGTGASSIVAEIARELGALTVGIVTKPFTFEGRKRMRQAEEGLEQLRECVDTLIVIPNQRLLHVVDRNTPLNAALRVADDVLTHATKGISEIITVPGLINVDFADVRSVMRGMGNALMGMGFAQGADRAREAAQMAISSPLLEDISIDGARALLVNFMGGEDMTLAEVDEASHHILQASGEDANVIFGAVVDPNIKDEIRVTLIATGFGAVCTEVPSQVPAAKGAEQLMAAELHAPQPISLMEEKRRRESAEQAQVPLGDCQPIADAPQPAVEGIGIGGVGTGQQAAQAAAAAAAAPVETPSHFADRAAAGRPSLLSDDGIVGRARPMRSTSGARPLSEPQPVSRVTAGMAGPPHGVAATPQGVAGLPQGAAPTPHSRVVRPPTAPVQVSSGSTAAADHIPETVTPLKWEERRPTRHGWKPRLSSPWQRVLRRDRLDVPSFLRRRQVD